jgi:hypothetical protein
MPEESVTEMVFTPSSVSEGCSLAEAMSLKRTFSEGFGTPAWPRTTSWPFVNLAIRRTLVPPTSRYRA